MTTKQLVCLSVGIKAAEKIQICNTSVYCEVLLPPIFSTPMKDRPPPFFKSDLTEWKLMSPVPTQIKAQIMNEANSKYISFSLQINYMI